MNEHEDFSVDELERVNKEMEELRAQERALAEKRAELARRQIQLEHEKENNKKVDVCFYEFKEGYVYTGSDYRTDVVAAMKSIPTRYYVPPRTNSFSASYVPLLLRELEKLKNITVTWRDGVREQYEAFINKPDYAITLRSTDFKIELPTNADALPLQRLPGAIYFRATQRQCAFYTIPIPEGWRLVDALHNKNRVDITPEARAFIEKQIADRARLDEIAKLEDIEYAPHFEIGYKLRPFQRVGAAFIEAAGGRAILADQMGLGKTWQAIAVMSKNKWRGIIVCPASLKPNWAREILKLTGKRPFVLQGTTPSTSDMVTMLHDKPQFTIVNYDIIAKKVDTDEMVKDQEGYTHEKHVERWLWIDLINMSKPDIVVLDEAHYVKNIDSLRSRATRQLDVPRILSMSGTPVMNRPGELWPLLNLIDKNAFPSHDDFVRRYGDGQRGVKNADELRELLKSKMIRRLKQDVIKDLPAVNRMTEYHELSEKARKLYRKVLNGVYELLSEWNPTEAENQKSVTNILVQIMRLKQICAYDKMEQTADHATEIYDSADPTTKWKKIIIFSQFISVVHGIAKRLGQEAICITGEDKPEERQRLVDKFQTDNSIHFAVCSTKAVSEGLTMTAAGTVIFHDQMWTPAAHEQAEGRAYGRLNDAHAIDTYWMVAEDTIEDEHIMPLLSEKMDMIDRVVEGFESIRDTSIAMSLIQKLREGLR